MTTAHPTASMLIIKFHKNFIELLKNNFPMNINKISALGSPMVLNFSLEIFPDASDK